jgi:hypothetical protein
VSCLAGIVALIFLLDWLKRGKLWYFAVWVFVMSLATLALAILPMPKKTEPPQVPAVVQFEEQSIKKVNIMGSERTMFE